jgi:hypothetical protein
VRSRTALLAGQTTALGLMMAFLVVPASTLFLYEYGARTLPWAYLAVAVAGVLTSALVSRAGRRMSLAGLASGLISAYLAIVGAGWLALVLWDVVSATFVLVVLFPLAIPVGFVAVGSQAVRLFDVRELKGQFPLVVAGFPIGFAVGGLVAGLIVGALGGVEQLLILGLACGLGMLVLVRRTAREFPAELLARPDPPPTAPASAGVRRDRRTSVLRDPLVAAVLGYTVLSGAVTQLLDFIVWERAAANFTDPQSLARFQGLYGSALNVASILFVALAASWLLRRYGVRLGLAANPTLVLVACLVMLAVGQGSGVAGLGFLTVACLAQVADITSTDGLTRGSVAATYQAMPPESRLSAQTLAEGAGTPVAIGLVGALLLLIQALSLDVIAVVWLVLVLSLLWLVLSLVTYRSYGGHLAEVLRHRAWDPRALRVEGEAAEAMVRRLLDSVEPSARTTGLEALADSGSPDLDRELVRALGDPHPRVRSRALDLAAPESLTGRPLLRDGLVGLLGPTPEGVRAAAILIGRDRDVDPQALGLWADALVSDDDALAEAAVAGAAMTPHPSHLPHLLDAAAKPGPPLGILEALGAHADLLGPTISSLWASTRDPSSPSGRQRELVVRAVAGAGRSRPRRWLLACLDEAGLSRSDLRLVVGSLAPTSWARQPASVPTSVLAGCLDAEALRVHAALIGLDHLQSAGAPRPGGPDPGLGLDIAESAFRDEIEEARRHVEILFGASACPRGTAWFRRALEDTEPQLRATAIELTEATLGRRRGAIVVAVLDPTLDDASRLDALEATGLGGRTGTGDPVAWLADVATDAGHTWDSAWLRASVLRCLPRLSPAHASRAAQSLADDPDPVVSQTAAWVLRR